MTLENSLNFLGLGFLISEMKDLEKNISKAPVLKFWEISFCLSLLVSLAFMQSPHTSHSYSFKTCSVHITPFLRTLPFIQRTSPGPVGPTWPVLLAAVPLRPHLLFPPSLLQPYWTLLFLARLRLGPLFLGLLHWKVRLLEFSFHRQQHCQLPLRVFTQM